jgi:glycosyltransferase involved in cell wall biosynthesis
MAQPALKTPDTDTKTHKKLNIWFFLPALNDGGAERALMNIAFELKKRGHSPAFVLLQKKGVFLEQVEAAKIAVEGLNIDPKVVLALPSFIKFLKNKKPDLLVSSLPAPDLLSLWACRILGEQAPSHIISSQNVWSDHVKEFKTWRAYIRHKGMILFDRWADHFAAVSGAVSEELQNVFNVQDNKITVIPNSLDLQKIQQQRHENPDHKWLFPGREHKVAIAVGRLNLQKDFETLIKAMPKVRKTLGDVKLIILGEGTEREKLETLRHKMALDEHIDLPGFKDNPFALVAASDVFILSSQWEGFGNVTIEALSVGTPVVATNCPGAPAEILENGKYGRLVERKNPNALAEGIIDVLNGNHPPEDVLLGRAQDYSIETVTDMYETLFRKVLKI